MRGGMLAVRGRRRDRHRGARGRVERRLQLLEQKLRETLAEAAARERAERVASAQMEAAAIRQIIGTAPARTPCARGRCNGLIPSQTSRNQ